MHAQQSHNMITPDMKEAGARALVNLGLLPTKFGSDSIAEMVFQEMLEASPYKLAAKSTAA
jgi:hypothetical protein